ncbi:ABC transporter substrate-binding protein [Luteipulveratus mongoliensis]|uniref:Glycine/betaine ABC transporter substrate-binding protein n=1 Tax=Luteipulveratus mongoliensis TaxID=571913 RepID=A0A0K1JP06_9MICO|nr:ABC transporter substrate-binding protein [Luteipulveratus mongoliensis]AKU18318.1 glycine/betaine ABC transporter substrate-binding protein [Luteipulveratus mongoliensis]
MRRTTSFVAALGVSVLALSGCGLSGDALESGGGGNCDDAKPKDGPIKIGSADFPESSLIAEVYAGALKAKGVQVSTTDPIGAREAYLKALSDGSVQIVPEYTNSLLTFLDKDAKAKGPDEIYAALLTTIPCDELALQKSAAEDSNAMVVPKSVADKWQLKTISDLAKHANEVTIAAPAEFRTREQGLLGLKSTYNLTPKSFRPLGNPQAISTALKNGQAQAANIFSTDPSITTNGFVVLKDDKALFGSDNVIPLIAKKAATPKVQVALNAVSAKLTTTNLAQMLKEVVVDKKSAKTVAAAFLKANGLA